MVYNIYDVMREVRVCLDQNMTSAQLLGTDDVDTLSFDDIVRSKIVESVVRVHSEAPVHLLESGHNFGEAVYWGELESGWVVLPHDFMRLIAFQMSDWERCLYQAITVEDQQYKIQRQRIKALRGTSQKPVCVITTYPEGKVLEFYSCKSRAAHVKRGQYLPYPKIDENGNIDICERCYTAVIYTAASLVLLTTGEFEKSKLLSETASTLLISQ